MDPLWIDIAGYKLNFNLNSAIGVYAGAQDIEMSRFEGVLALSTR
jgi:hypothetical protein